MKRSKICAWCHEPIGSRLRRDAVHCSKRCRQAHHRFGSALGRTVAARSPRRFGYADPPYPGTARRYYATHPDFAGEVDHAELVARLVREFPDGWALSTSAQSLRAVLALCPPGVRVGAWVRGERPAKSYTPLMAWEPVIFCGGRRVLRPAAERRTDSLVHFARPRLTDKRRVIGAKPAAFCGWLFELLGMQRGDELVDLFPGSGGVARAWRRASADASCLEGRVAVRSQRDASSPAPPDASSRTSRDASSRTSRDASPAAAGDGSARSRAEASRGSTRRVAPGDRGRVARRRAGRVVPAGATPTAAAPHPRKGARHAAH